MRDKIAVTNKKTRFMQNLVFFINKTLKNIRIYVAYCIKNLGQNHYILWLSFCVFLHPVGFPSDIVEESLICIGYGMTMPIKKLEEYYSVGMLDEVYNIGIPFISVEKPLFTQMVKEIIDGTYDDVDWEDKLTINFRKKLQGIR